MNILESRRWHPILILEQVKDHQKSQLLLRESKKERTREIRLYLFIQEKRFKKKKKDQEEKEMERKERDRGNLRASS